VKAYWFHVRERGVFGAIFGTLISFGVYFALIGAMPSAEMTKAHPAGNLGWLHRWVQNLFAPEGGSVDATWAVFFIPAAILVLWALLDWWLIRTRRRRPISPPSKPRRFRRPDARGTDHDGFC